MMRSIFSARRLAALVPLLAAIALLIQGGRNPYEGLVALYRYAIGGSYEWAALLSRAGPLIVAGLSFAVSFRTGVINLGIESQVYLGAMTAAWVGFAIGWLPGWLHTTLATVLAVAAGSAVAALIGWVRDRYAVDEAISSIMLNYLAVLFTSYLATYPFRDPQRWSGTTPLILPTAEYRTIIPDTQLSSGIFLALGAVLFVTWILYRTRLGFTWRMHGLNPTASAWAGLPTTALVTSNMALSGALAGLCGALLVLGFQHRFWSGIGGSVPWDGIMLSLMVDHQPLLLIVAGLFVAGFLNGVTGAESVTQMPSETGEVILSLVLLSALLARQTARESGEARQP